jgi:heme-degrading monooxygenase HmoA
MSRQGRRVRDAVGLVLRRVGWVRFALFTLTAGCTLAKPYVDTSDRAGSPAGDVVVVVTHAVIDNQERAPFDAYVHRLSDAMDSRKYDGLLGFSIRKILFGDEVWTLTVWRDEASLRGFMRSGMHREAIAAAPGAVLSLRSRHFTRAADAPPITWAEAIAKLEQREGERSAATR